MSLREQGKIAAAPAAVFYLPEMTPPSGVSLASPTRGRGYQALKLVGNGRLMKLELPPIESTAIVVKWVAIRSFKNALVSA
ncbi:unnamed protein product [marine sediment metagenome]|uniref:Uncharacterized protein n=1 Tax=marine sediment metagenome TaxID=412755 RepID=X1NBY9_9ZZZZ